MRNHNPGSKRGAGIGYRAADGTPLSAAEFCPVCFLIFGRDERKVRVGDQVTHPACAGRLRTKG